MELAFGQGKHTWYAAPYIGLFSSAAHLSVPYEFGPDESANENLGGEWEIG
jgi:hypothetical protein